MKADHREVIRLTAKVQSLVDGSPEGQLRRMMLKRYREALVPRRPLMINDLRRWLRGAIRQHGLTEKHPDLRKFIGRSHGKAEAEAADEGGAREV